MHEHAVPGLDLVATKHPDLATRRTACTTPLYGGPCWESIRAPSSRRSPTMKMLRSSSLKSAPTPGGCPAVGAVRRRHRSTTGEKDPDDGGLWILGRSRSTFRRWPRG